MQALVTGAAGFVGVHLVRRLRDEGHEVHALTLPQEWMPVDLATVPRHACDVTDERALEKVLRETAPDWIFHLAAISNPRTCRENPALAWEVNFLGTHALYRAAADAVGGARVLFVGSAVEYGRPAPAELPLTEECALRPNDVYAATKVAGDLAGAAFALSGRLAVIRVRPFNHIGPGQTLGFVATDFARQIARIEARRQEPEMRVGNLAAERDFSDVRDVVRAYVRLMEKGEPGEAYNVSSDVARPVRDLLDGLKGLAHVEGELKVHSAGPRSNEPDRIVGCSEKLRAATGWSPEVPWQQTLLDLLNDWRRRVAAE